MPRASAFIQYPFAKAGEYANHDYAHDSLLVTQWPHPKLAFYRDALVAFMPGQGEDWVAKRQWQEGDLARLYGHIGVARAKQLESEEFWSLYRQAMTHPRELLDKAAREAFKSLEGM